MRIFQFAMLLALFGLVSAYDINVTVLEPSGPVALYNGSSFPVSANVSCGPSECGDVDVTLMAAQAPKSCMDILDAMPGSDDGIYTVCPTEAICRSVYCDMENGGWASIFTLEEELTLTDRDCIMHNYNDDMDSVILWTDLTCRVADSNTYSPASQSYFTWNRDGSENMVPGYLPDRPAGLGEYARPVPLPAANKTVWFDWENEEIVWEGGSAAFSDAGLDPDIFGGESYGTSFYAISDGVNMIHLGSHGGYGVRLLKFDFYTDTVSGEDAIFFSPGISWSTEEDAFHTILYTVNGRVMYFYDYIYDNSTGEFRLGGTLANPNSQAEAYNVPAWEHPSQPDFDFFAMVDEESHLWFGDWGHDNGGYFDCGNDEYLGVGKTSIMLTYDESGGTAGAAEPVSETEGDVPFFTTDSNPQTFSIGADESAVAEWEVNATEPGVFFFFVIANETDTPFLGNKSSQWGVKTYELAPPVPVQISPDDGKYMYPEEFSFVFSCGQGIIGTIQLWTDLGGSWEMAYDNSCYDGGEVLSVNAEATDVGNFSWAVWCNATYGGEAWSANRSIQVVDSGVFGCWDLDTPGTYTLITDVAAEGSSSCFDIDSPDVVLDCAGHSIIGNGCTDGQSGVYSEQQNTTVRNCNISDFCQAIYFESASGSGLIEYNNLTDSTYGVRMEYSNYNSVLGNRFERNDFGFYLYYADSNMIGRNTLIETDDANFGSGSCPFLYLYDGEEYGYYTDLASEVIGKPKYETPLYEAGIYELGGYRSEGGVYRMKIREVIPESDFVDEIKLLVVDVPEGYGVLNQWHNTYSDDMAPPKEFMTVKDPRAPASAIDSYGNDVLAEVSEKDGVPLPMKADEPNSVVVDFGSIENPQHAKLVITGWSAYGTKIPAPSQENLLIETMDVNGEWVEAKRFGKFTGDSRTFVFDIADIPKADDTRMRITAAYSRSNAKIIDQILLDDSEPVEMEVAAISPSVADLHPGGSTNFNYTTIWSRIEATDEQLPDREEFLMYGDFTKYGDVRPLLEGTDDKFAILRHGDELGLEFQDVAPAEGKDRFAFLQADVMYSVKYDGGGEFVSDSVELMPFHGMSQYPYGEDEAYPDDAEHNAYRSEWNTRSYDAPVKYGGSLPWSFNNTVFENTFVGDEYSTALYLEHEDATSLLDNNISDVEVGIELYESDNSIVRGNAVSAQYGWAMRMTSYSDNNSVINNSLVSDSSSSCYFGNCGALYVSNSDANIIDNNSLQGIGGYGIYIWSGLDNVVTNNSIESSDDPMFAAYLIEDSSGNVLLHNTIRSDYWVHDESGGNTFSDSVSGNAYFDADGTGAWDIFQIFDADSDGWADWGADLPFGCGSVGNCGSAYGYWSGEGGDEHPYTLVEQALPASEDEDEGAESLSLAVDSSCEESVVTVTSGGDSVPNARVYVKDSLNNEVALGFTDADGEYAFEGCGMEVGVHASKSGYLPADAEFGLVACGSCNETAAPVIPPVPECTDDSACADDEECVNSECASVSCECGAVQGHTCVEYACCSDSDCAADEVCTGNACLEKPAQSECASDNDCASGKECRDGACSDKPAPPAEDPLKAGAMAGMDDAQDEISAAKAAGKDTAAAKAKLAEAQAAYDAGNYEQAKDLATQARTLAQGAAPQAGPDDGAAAKPGEGGADWPWAIALLVIVALLGGLYWFVLRKGKR